ncbi:MAG TPA: shikimate kinase, partial [Ruminococcaceae bacterium]|nr:shikimate kinase [Oscillospiraceae bacterium]
MKNIVLCGFMGSGKSSVGTALALLSKMRFIDMDRYIEKQEKQTISAIFQKYGEDHFRDLESRCAAKLSTQSNQIIATGGGAVLRPQNIRSFRSNGIIVFLNIPFPMVRKRLRGDKTRPLLKTSPSVVHALYKKRMP